jgi:hypothetical protein
LDDDDERNDDSGAKKHEAQHRDAFFPPFFFVEGVGVLVVGVDIDDGDIIEANISLLFLFVSPVSLSQG